VKEKALYTRVFEALGLRQRADGFAGFPFGEADLVETPQIQPEFRAGAKEMSQAQRRIPGYGPASIQNLRDAVGRNIEPPRKFGGTHSQLSTFFNQVFPWIVAHSARDVLAGIRGGKTNWLLQQANIW
jgi:hypothetical protein